MKVLGVILLCFAAATDAVAQEFPMPQAAADTNSELGRSMPQLATRVLAEYRDGDRETYLDNLFRLQSRDANAAILFTRPSDIARRPVHVLAEVCEILFAGMT